MNWTPQLFGYCDFSVAGGATAKHVSHRVGCEIVFGLKGAKRPTQDA